MSIRTICKPGQRVTALTIIFALLLGVNSAQRLSAEPPALAAAPTAVKATAKTNDAASSSRTIARCGQGWLEEINGYRVLHLKGTPYEMGYQHGALLRESVRANMKYLLDVKGSEGVKVGPITVKPRIAIEAIVKGQEKYVPKRFFEELQGLSAGAEIPVNDIRAANFIPELFHCSGFALLKETTRDGKLYHGRVLDYAIDWKLQEHAVLIVAEPDQGFPFVNVSYSGFIGSVSGMNVKHISIGEMGGGGLMHWDGVPMAVLMRQVLETADSVEKGVAVFRDQPRTCEYYYVIADGVRNKAVALEACWDRFTMLKPGEQHALLPTPVENCVLLSAGDRYTELVKRAKANAGKFDRESARDLMACGVAMKNSNLHNVLFEPESTKLWVANASPDKKPAADQPYHEFQLSELLTRKPSVEAKELPLIPVASVKP